MVICAPANVKESRTRNWCVTLWSREDVERLEGLPAPLLVVGEEVCPETGRVHYHAYVEFPHPARFSTLHTHFPNAHFEPRKGTVAQAIEYALKDGKVVVNRIPEQVPRRVKKVYKAGEVEVEVHRRLREGDTIRQIWADHPIYCARNMRMLRAVVRVYELWGHRQDGGSVDNLSGVDL